MQFSESFCDDSEKYRSEVAVHISIIFFNVYTLHLIRHKIQIVNVMIQTIRAFSHYYFLDSNRSQCATARRTNRMRTTTHGYKRLKFNFYPTAKKVSSLSRQWPNTSLRPPMMPRASLDAVGGVVDVVEGLVARAAAGRERGALHPRRGWPAGQTDAAALPSGRNTDALEEHRYIGVFIWRKY